MIARTGILAPGTGAEFARVLAEGIAKRKKVAQTANIKGE